MCRVARRKGPRVADRHPQVSTTFATFRPFPFAGPVVYATVPTSDQGWVYLVAASDCPSGSCPPPPTTELPETDMNSICSAPENAAVPDGGAADAEATAASSGPAQGSGTGVGQSSGSEGATPADSLTVSGASGDAEALGMAQHQDRSVTEGPANGDEKSVGAHPQGSVEPVQEGSGLVGMDKDPATGTSDGVSPLDRRHRSDAAVLAPVAGQQETAAQGTVSPLQARECVPCVCVCMCVCVCPACSASFLPPRLSRAT